MQLEFSDDPVKAFKQLRLIHFAFAASVLLMVFAAELLASHNDGPMGDLEGFAWTFRLFIAGYYALLLVPLAVLANERRYVAKGMKVDPRKPDLVVKNALEATQIFRSSLSHFPAIVGMILFILSDERLDLYVPVSASVLLLFFTRPTHKHWEETYAMASREYPGISPSPWAS